MSNKNSKLDDIALMKTFMMILVVLYHSMMFFSNKWFTIVQPIYQANYLYKIALFLNSFHIQSFAMASGFIYFYLLNSKKEDSLKNRILKRAKRLLIPYAITSIFWVVPFSIVLLNYSLLDIFKNFILVVNPSQLWFLIMLFNVFVFFEFFNKRIRFNCTHFFTIFIITVLLSNILRYYHVNYFQICKTIEYILYFYLGGFIYQHNSKITKKQLIICFSTLFVLYIVKIGGDYFNSSIIHYMIKFFEPMISVLEIVLLYSFFKYLSKRINFANKSYIIIEDNSFGIYLFHQQIIYLTILLMNGVVNPILQVFISFIISFVISLMISILLKKNKITKCIFGL